MCNPWDYYLRTTSFCFRVDVDSPKCQRPPCDIYGLKAAPKLKLFHSPCSWTLWRRLCLCDVLMMQTYSCQCHAHLQLLSWLVLWLLWGFSNPFCLMLAKVPWEKFLHYWTGRVGDASGVLQAWVGLPLGLIQCAWCSSGKNWWTGWINEHSFNVS